MNRYDVEMALSKIGEARSAWGRAQTDFTKSVETSMKRLLHEAAAVRMSPQDVAKHTGMTAKRVRLLMKQHGLDPTKGKVLLSQQAATALAENAELLGIDPHEMDLMSPLAYLPMGRQMRDALQSEAVRGVHEVEEEPEAEGYWCIDCEMFEQDDPEETTGEERGDLIANRCQFCGCGNDTHKRVSIMA